MKEATSRGKNASKTAGRCETYREMARRPSREVRHSDWRLSGQTLSLVRERAPFVPQDQEEQTQCTSHEQRLQGESWDAIAYSY